MHSLLRNPFTNSNALAESQGAARPPSRREWSHACECTLQNISRDALALHFQRAHKYATNMCVVRYVLYVCDKKSQKNIQINRWHRVK